MVISTHRLPKVTARHQNAMITPFIDVEALAEFQRTVASETSTLPKVNTT